MTYYPKGHPKYKPDTRKGDRHKNKEERNKEDRHLTNGDHHVNRSRAKNEFIAIDGEGITTNRIVGYSPTGEPVYEQLYSLLMASSGDNDYSINENGLSTTQCFDSLLTISDEHPNGILVYYGGNYDTDMMLRDLPKDKLQEMYDSKRNNPDRNPTYFTGKNNKEYSLSRFPGKSFTIRRDPYWSEEKDSQGSSYFARKWKASVTIYDVSGFFQCRFVDALGDKERGYFTEYLHEEIIDGETHEVITWPDGLRIDLTRMKTMKNSRRLFTLDQLEEEIVSYCRDEVRALQRLMERLRDYLDEAQLLPSRSRWIGAGACASTLLERHHVKEHMKEQIPDNALIDAQRRAYSYGRIELGKFGVYIGKVYNYDIHSAFPSVLPLLPSLTNGMWRRIRGMSNKPYSLMHVKWGFSGDIPYFPFFYRKSNLSIYFPPIGEGWYWKPEVDAALRALNDGKLSTGKWDGKIEIIESWEFQPYSNAKPFAFVPELYQTRKLWEELGNAASKVLKFTLNSIYGKLIQSVGGTEQSKPPYHNVGYAGYVTSFIRARIFDAIMQAPDDIIMVVTDGIYSTKKLTLDEGEGLGQWECKELDGIIAVQSGVYWGLTKLGRDPTPQELQEEFSNGKYWNYNGEWFKVNPHYQGYDRGALTPDIVMKAWKNTQVFGNMPVPATRFVTVGSALSNEELWHFWRTWRPIDRKLELYPQGKRVSYQEPSDLQPYNELHDTVARLLYELEPDELSHKCRLAWDPDEENFIIDGVDLNTFVEELMEGEL